MTISSKLLMSSIAAAALLATPALAEDRSTEKQKEQYIYQQSQDQGLGASDQGAIGATKPNSGPGVQGPADTRTGPATKSPDGSAAAPDAGDAASGTSAGDSGMSGENATQPSQDSSGVQGFPDTRTGPATRSPDGAEGSGN